MTGDGWTKDSDGLLGEGRPARGLHRRDAGRQQAPRPDAADPADPVRGRRLRDGDPHHDPGRAVREVAPNGDFQAALYTLIDTFPEPLNLSATLKSTNAPSEANGFSGINFGRVSIDGLDEVLDRIDSETDEAARVEASREADQLIGEAVPAIPIVAVPNVLLWSEKLGGPISINPSEGPFWNLDEWGLAE